MGNNEIKGCQTKNIEGFVRFIKKTLTNTRKKCYFYAPFLYRLRSTPSGLFFSCIEI